MTYTALSRQEDGSYKSSLRTEWKELVAFCGREVLAILTSNSEVGRRLTPDAYAEDPKAQEEFEELIGTELSEQRIADVESLIALADAEELSSEEVESCIRALTVIRQIYAEYLGVRTGAEAGEENQVRTESEAAEELHAAECVLSPLDINKKSFSQPLRFYKQIYGPLAALQEQLIGDYAATS